MDKNSDGETRNVYRILVWKSFEYHHLEDRQMRG
jgi:hypothetical protein